MPVSSARVVVLVAVAVYQICFYKAKQEVKRDDQNRAVILTVLQLP